MADISIGELAYIVSSLIFERHDEDDTLEAAVSPVSAVQYTREVGSRHSQPGAGAVISKYWHPRSGNAGSDVGSCTWDSPRAIGSWIG